MYQPHLDNLGMMNVFNFLEDAIKSFFNREFMRFIFENYIIQPPENFLLNIDDLLIVVYDFSHVFKMYVLRMPMNLYPDKFKNDIWIGCQQNRKKPYQIIFYFLGLILALNQLIIKYY